MTLNQVGAPGGFELLGIADGPSGVLRLLASPPSLSSPLWMAHVQGLKRSYEAMGVGHMAPSPEALGLVPVFVVAQTEDGVVRGGCRVQRHADFKHMEHLPVLHEAVMARAEQLNGEISGVWVDPAIREYRIGTALVAATARIAARLGRRFSFSVANEISIRVCLQIGYTADERAVDLSYPDDRFPSTLVWYDHHQQQDVVRLAAVDG